MANPSQPPLESDATTRRLDGLVNPSAPGWRVLTRREREDGTIVYEYESVSLPQALSYMNGDPGWRQAGPERSAFGILARWLFGR